MIPTNNEHYELSLIKRNKNSAYTWEEAPTIIFKGRPASNVEKKNYRLQKGVNGNTDSTFVFVTNLPEEVDVGDTVKFLGKEWVVLSVGYYFNNALFVNPSNLSEEQIIERCPKGLNLQ